MNICQTLGMFLNSQVCQYTHHLEFQQQTNLIYVCYHRSLMLT